MMRRAIPIVASVVFCAGAASSPTLGSDIERGVYVGGSIGQSGFDLDRAVEDLRIDGDDTGYKALLGIRILPFLAVEGGYIDFGSDSETVGDLDLGAESTAWHGFALGILPVGPVDLFVKGGLARWESDVRLTNRGLRVEASDSGTGSALGAGVAVRLGRVSIRAEYERFDVSDVGDLELASVGFTYTF